MYPHERSLVKRLVDKPFVIIGVNSDKREAAKAAVTENELTWRSFWDGGSTGGPIAKKWNVSGWPTLYIIDSEGVIRHKNLRGPKMNEAIDGLLAKLDGQAKTGEAEKNESK